VELLDQFGRPIVKEIIAERGGQARTFKDQPHWQHSVAVGMGPDRLADILRRNDFEGDHVDLLTLGKEMEERDLHYFSQLQSRINAIAHVPMRVEPFDDTDKRAQKIADEFNELVIQKDDESWSTLIQGLMDAVPMGYSVIQPVWDTSTRPWTFKSFEWVDQRCFHYDPKTRKTLRVRQDDNPEGYPIPAGLFLVHNPRIRCGYKLRGSIARLACVNVFFKTTEVQDWLSFCETYGMPLRIGRYNPQVHGEQEQYTLQQALINLGHDASAMIPEGMKLEVLDARRPTSGDNLYAGVVRYIDEQTSRAVLGQVLAADARATGLGTAVAELHREVRQDIREADAKAIRATVGYLIKVWLYLNYGASAPRLRLVLDIDPPAELETLTKALLPWYVQGGVKIPKKWFYKTFNIPEPKDGEETLSAPLAPGTPGAGPVAGVKSAKGAKGPAKEE
jgi:phage gp29-like protein